MKSEFGFLLYLLEMGHWGLDITLVKCVGYDFRFSHCIVLELPIWVSHQMGFSSFDIFIALNGSLPLLMDKLKMKMAIFYFILFLYVLVTNGFQMVYL